MALMDRFVFIHINKCAGTSFLNMIRREFKGRVAYDNAYKKDMILETYITTSRSENYYPKCFDKNNNFNLVEGHHVRFVIGHFSIHKYKHLGWPIITFVREPIARLLSAYGLWMTKGKWTVYDREPVGHFSRTLGLFARLNQNKMTTLIGRDLSKLQFIGLVERFKESMSILQKMLGVEFAEETLKIRHNVTPHKRKLEFTEEQVDFLKKVNYLDMALYKKASEIFDKQVEKYL